MRLVPARNLESRCRLSILMECQQTICFRPSGLAGIREGNVSLDAHHPHFLIAHSGATSDECLRLIERVREQVLLQTGIDLQLNLQIW